MMFFVSSSWLNFFQLHVGYVLCCLLENFSALKMLIRTHPNIVGSRFFKLVLSWDNWINAEFGETYFNLKATTDINMLNLYNFNCSSLKIGQFHSPNILIKWREQANQQTEALNSHSDNQKSILYLNACDTYLAMCKRFLQQLMA